MNGALDLDPTTEADALSESSLHWPQVRAWVQAHPDSLTGDAALLQEMGLEARGKVVDLGRAALTKLEAVAEREAGARKQIEMVARANFAAQTQTHAAALDLMEARSHADLARRLDAAAQARFGLAAAAIALEKPGGVPFGWRGLIAGKVDRLVGDDGLHWLGENFEGLDLFGSAEDQVKSVALIRMAPQFAGGAARNALCAFGSPDIDGFTPAMGCELAAFITRVVERMAERWPVLG
ncbi:DUF484 family protein [Brevundimonas sp.]|uniref:DUF484 family protein n=1 Tax=Brevundimonas sp. TaxID=1871086 RepID=UPI002FD8C91F